MLFTFKKHITKFIFILWCGGIANIISPTPPTKPPSGPRPEIHRTQKERPGKELREVTPVPHRPPSAPRPALRPSAGGRRLLTADGPVPLKLQLSDHTLPQIDTPIPVPPPRPPHPYEETLHPSVKIKRPLATKAPTPQKAEPSDQPLPQIDTPKTFSNAWRLLKNSLRAFSTSAKPPPTVTLPKGDAHLQKRFDQLKPTRQKIFLEMYRSGASGTDPNEMMNFAEQGDAYRLPSLNTRLPASAIPQPVSSRKFEALSREKRTKALEDLSGGAEGIVDEKDALQFLKSGRSLFTTKTQPKVEALREAHPVPLKDFDALSPEERTRTLENLSGGAQGIVDEKDARFFLRNGRSPITTSAQPQADASQ